MGATWGFCSKNAFLILSQPVFAAFIRLTLVNSINKLGHTVNSGNFWSHKQSNRRIVNGSRSTSPDCVLCVGLDADEVAARIDLGGRACECCPDVFRAMARLDRLQPAAVVVLVDWLSAAEFEFFQIAARMHRHIPVYVVGSERCRHKVDQAVRCGACGEANLDSLPRLRTAASEPDSPEQTPVEPEAATTTVDTDQQTELTESEEALEDQFASTGNVLDDELDRRLWDQAASTYRSAVGDSRPGHPVEPHDTEPEENEGTTGQTVDGDPDLQHSELTNESDEQDVDIVRPPQSRVPWLRYEGGPTRVPPKRVRPTSCETASAPATDPSDEDDHQNQREQASDHRDNEPRGEGGEQSTLKIAEQLPDYTDPPLLTPEELNALLGDKDQNQTD